MSTADPYVEWDAAYVLGSLSMSERLEYEAHLAECPSCREALAELSGLPGLLSRVPAPEALTLLEPETGADPEPVPPGDLRSPGPVPIRSATRVRFPARALVGVAAAVLVALSAVLLPGVIGRTGSPPSTTFALSQVGSQTALTATVRLTPHEWGTQVEADCTYAAGPASWGAPGSAVRTYALVATDRTGVTSQVSTWQSRPGQVVHATGTTDLAAADIASLHIESVPDGTVLLGAAVPRPG